MTPVFQTKFGRFEGNCLQAAIASVLDLKLEEVPDFAAYGPGIEWFNPFLLWTKSRDLGVVYFNLDMDVAAVDCFGIACCSVIGCEDEYHAVVVRFERTERDPGKLTYVAVVMHDPNPRGVAIKNMEAFIVFVR